MGKIYVVGMGSGRVDELPTRNLELLSGHCPEGGAPVWLRTGSHPVAEWLSERGLAWSSFDYLYEQAGDFEQLYRQIYGELLARAKATPVLVYGVPGHPLVGERTVLFLLERNRGGEDRGKVEVEVVGAPSFLEAVAVALDKDLLAEGVELVDADFPPAWFPRADKPLLVTQVWHPYLLSQLKLRLLDVYPPDHRVAAVFWAPPVLRSPAIGPPARTPPLSTATLGGRERLEWVPLEELDRLPARSGPAISIWVPALLPGVHPAALAQKVARVVEVVARLRGEGGCPWDREQTHLSLRPYVIEEAYEVAEAIRMQDTRAQSVAAQDAGVKEAADKLAEELGDLLLQVALHAQIAQEEGRFDLGRVCDVLVDKLVRRHPHVFADRPVRSTEQVLRRWNEIKGEERGAGASVLEGIPSALPALQRAWRMQGRAHEVGFDWEPGDVAGVLAKVQEELEELRREVGRSGSREAVRRELGDLFFAAVNAARLLGVDPEVALQEAADRFAARFRRVEEVVRSQGREMSSMTMKELDFLWEEAKKKEERH